MPVSIRDVASHVGVSHGTVSKALGGASRYNIPDATRRRIQESAEALGYRPNRAALALKTGRTQTLGLVTAGFRNPFFPALMESAESLLVEAGYQMLVLDAGADSFGTRRRRPSPAGWPVDGVLMWADVHQNLAMYVGAQAAGLPVVYLGYPRDDGADTASFDLAGGARQAAAHLWERGYKRWAFAYPPYSADWPQADPRFRACQDFCAEHHDSLEALPLDATEETGEAGRRVGLAVAARPPDARTDAILCLNDVLAIGLYHGLRRGGLRVPEDVAVVGFDGLREGQTLDRPLTTVSTSTEALCRAALDLLLARIGGDRDTPPQRIVIPATLLVGETT